MPVKPRDPYQLDIDSCIINKMARIKPRTDEEESEDAPYKQTGMKKCILISYLAYSIVFVLISAGYLVWILYQRSAALTELGGDPGRVRVEAVPTLLALCICPLLLLYTLIAGCIAEPPTWNYSDLKTWIDMAFFFWSTATTLFAVQIVVLLCLSMKEYLAILPLHAACHCIPPEPLSGSCPGGAFYCAAGILQCQCRVPYRDDSVYMLTDNVNNVNTDLFSRHHVTYEGEIEVWTSVNATSEEDVPWLREYPKMDMLLLLLQLSFVVTTLRFPVNIGTKYIKAEGALSDLEDKPSGSEYISDGVSMCLFALSEGLDAFSLLDDVLTYPDFFLENRHLLNAVLAFISIAILQLNSPDLPKTAKIVVLLLINIPFLVIRIVIFNLFSDIEFQDSSAGRQRAVFLFFILKEVLVIVLTSIEVIFEALVEPLQKLCEAWNEDDAEDTTSSTKSF